MKTDLLGRVAIVTGGSEGIGRAIALRMAESGADVVIGTRNAEKAAPVVQQIRAMGRKALHVPVDIESYPSAVQMVQTAIREFGKVDIMVANGAPHVREARARPFHEIDPANYEAYFRSRLFGRLYCVRAALDHMRERQYGKIVSVTTDAGRYPTPSESLIGAAASGLIMATKTLAREFSRWRIRINAVATTLTADTPGYDRFAKIRESNEVIAKAFKKIEERIPLGRMNLPDDIAHAVVYLASPESDQITGMTLSVNGGISFPG
ncbi:MAG: SDR family oxidoreductase [Chloroflexi bacterium]|nr:SDR family oxidoreductase [Chloroflexota bacterium]